LLNRALALSYRKNNLSSFLSYESLKGKQIRHLVLTSAEVQCSAQLKDKNWYIRRNAATVELIRVEFLLKLNSGQPCVLTGVVNVSCSGHRIISEKVGSRLILLNELGKVNTSSTLFQGRLQGNIVLSSEVQRLTKIELIDSS